MMMVPRCADRVEDSYQNMIRHLGTSTQENAVLHVDDHKLDIHNGKALLHQTMTPDD